MRGLVLAASLGGGLILSQDMRSGPTLDSFEGRATHSQMTMGQATRCDTALVKSALSQQLPIEDTESGALWQCSCCGSTPIEKQGALSPITSANANNRTVVTLVYVFLPFTYLETGISTKSSTIPYPLEVF